MPTRITALAVSKSFNGRTVLDAVTCSLGAGERTGIIGENGAGKSTLLRLFAGSEQPDQGEIVVHAEGGVGYLAQDEQLPAHLSVQQIIDRSLHELRWIEDRMRRLEIEMATGDESRLGEYVELATIFELRGGYDADARVERALHGLGLGVVRRDRAIGGLSGGEQARLRMAALLAAAPEVLLLDEPTTHSQNGFRMPEQPPVTAPTVLHPMPGQPRVVLLKPLVTSPLIEVGEYSYYDDPDDPTTFETRNVLYHYGPEKLIIGKFCALATGVRFIMNGANHRMDGPSTFPFPTMGGAWSRHVDLLMDLPNRGDTVIGNDVWIGYGATVMPGVRIGHGAIVGAGSVVTADVPDYGIVGGTPAELIRHRFSADDIDRLLALAWWDWPVEHIDENVRTIMSGTVDDLEKAVPAQVV